MIDAVRQTVGRYDMLQSGDSVTVALSGGADSVALLHVLYSLKEEYNLNLSAAHLNHGIRGEEAKRDEDFCKILCENYNIPIIIKHADIPKLSAERGISEELCGRQERYAFFEEAANGGKIATAHTASDNAETLIFNLTRGATLKGAAGIPPVRGRLIRPLIGCTRADIEKYCRDNRLDYMTDSTNLTDEYTRNKLRHRVIPVLKELNPGFEQAAARFCENAAAARDYIKRQTDELIARAKTDYGYSAEVLKNADPALRDEALYELCKRFGADAEYRHIRLLDAVLDGGAVDFGTCTAMCRQGILRISEKNTEKQDMEIPFDGKISVKRGDTIITASIDISDKELKSLVFRSRKSGDRFTFAGRGVTKPLRKALNEQKIPCELRDGLWLLADGQRVLWCEGLGYSLDGEELRNKNGLTINVERGYCYA